MQVTVWRLKGFGGLVTRTVLVRGDGSLWQLRVEQGERVIHSEQHPNLDVALLRAKAMWVECERYGWRGV